MLKKLFFDERQIKFANTIKDLDYRYANIVFIMSYRDRSKDRHRR